MLHIVTALACEAKPLIQYYRLNGRQAENGFRIYENDTLRVIVSGPGKTAAAAACAYLQAQSPDEKHIWLNLGIAGHGSLEVGEAFLAHKIIDAATGKAWYPGLPFTPPCQTAMLTTVDQAQNEYRDNAAWDMEASGFYATANRFNSSELIHAFKIVSDNRAQPADQVSAKQTEALVSAQLNTLDAVITRLQQLNHLAMQQQPPLQSMQTFQQQWHFTASQQHQLQRLLQRWQACTDTTLDVRQFATAKNSAQVLTEIKTMLKKLPLEFDQHD